jgi:hypothetical protein
MSASVGCEHSACDIPSGPVEAGNKSISDWVTAETKDNGDRCRCPLGGERRNGGICGDHGDLMTN